MSQKKAMMELNGKLLIVNKELKLKKPNDYKSCKDWYNNKFYDITLKTKIDESSNFKNFKERCKYDAMILFLEKMYYKVIVDNNSIKSEIHKHILKLRNAKRGFDVMEEAYKVTIPVSTELIKYADYINEYLLVIRKIKIETPNVAKTLYEELIYQLYYDVNESEIVLMMKEKHLNDFNAFYVYEPFLFSPEDLLSKLLENVTNSNYNLDYDNIDIDLDDIVDDELISEIKKNEENNNKKDNESRKASFDNFDIDSMFEKDPTDNKNKITEEKNVSNNVKTIKDENLEVIDNPKEETSVIHDDSKKKANEVQKEEDIKEEDIKEEDTKEEDTKEEDTIEEDTIEEMRNNEHDKPKKIKNVFEEEEEDVPEEISDTHDINMREKGSFFLEELKTSNKCDDGKTTLNEPISIKTPENKNVILSDLQTIENKFENITLKKEKTKKITNETEITYEEIILDNNNNKEIIKTEKNVDSNEKIDKQKKIKKRKRDKNKIDTENNKKKKENTTNENDLDKNLDNYLDNKVESLLKDQKIINETTNAKKNCFVGEEIEKKQNSEEHIDKNKKYIQNNGFTVENVEKYVKEETNKNQIHDEQIKKEDIFKFVDLELNNYDDENKKKIIKRIINKKLNTCITKKSNKKCYFDENKGTANIEMTQNNKTNRYSVCDKCESLFSNLLIALEKKDSLVPKEKIKETLKKIFE